ncbi:hypothetical protein JCM19237_934 [Photobacterium aphoticum]|uniref:Disulfide bond formation protein B n=1 Tax=Photobacterium aphoticum TaxID=754436 RepID=A0A090QXT1_9GAMM|nr:hypothetical protein JCM19237_934 [Photobacterium aphoticum]
MNPSFVTLLNTLGLLGITVVLLIGFVLQIAWDELPCPLCLLQRIGFGMVMFGSCSMSCTARNNAIMGWY